MALALASSPWLRRAGPATPLFASDQPIQITIKGPISALASKRSTGNQPGTLTHAGSRLSDRPLAARDHPSEEGRLPVPAAARGIPAAAARRLAVRRPAPAEAGHPLPRIGGLPAEGAARICRLPPVQSADSAELPRAARQHRLCRRQREAGRLSRRLFHRGHRRRRPAQQHGQAAHPRPHSRDPARPARVGAVRGVQLHDRQPRLVDARRPGRRRLLPQRPAARPPPVRRADDSRSPTISTFPGWSTRLMPKRRTRSASAASASAPTAAIACTMPTRPPLPPKCRAAAARSSACSAPSREWTNAPAVGRRPTSTASSRTSPAAELLQELRQLVLGLLGGGGGAASSIPS